MKQLTEKEIKALKAKIKADAKGEDQSDDVFEVKYKGGFIYFKTPNRNEGEYILSQVTSGPLGMVEALVEQCWLTGDETVKTDPKFLMSMVHKTDEIMGVSAVKIKNY